MTLPDDQVKCAQCGAVHHISCMLARYGDVLCPPCAKYIDEAEFEEEDYYDFLGEPPEPEEPISWHTINIYTTEKGGVKAVHSTNDNLDEGWASEYATWETEYSSLEEAKKVCGKTRKGILCDVTVYINGILYE